MNTSNGPSVVLKYHNLDKGLITYATLVLNAFGGNVSFPDAVSKLVLLKTNIDALHAAETAPKGTYTAWQIRAKRLAVMQVLRQLKEYVQSVIETQTSIPDAIAMIESVLMRARIYTKPNKAMLAAQNKGLSGSVKLTAKAVAEDAVYYWSYSVDGKTWVSAPDTFKASTTITGLTVAQTYYFRFRALSRQGETDFSPVVSLLVI